MARLWTCGFELQSVTAGVEVAAVNGTPAISTTVRRAGSAALRCNPTAGTQYVEHHLDAGTVKRTLHRFYLRIGTLPSADCNIYGIGQSGYFPGLVRLTTTGAIVLRDGFTSANLGSPTAPLTVGRWYRIELDYTDVAGTAGSVTGAFKGYLDGVLFADTLCSNINGWSRIRAGVQSAATTDIYIDDIAVNDTTGSVQNGLPGPGCVVHLRPDSAGDATGWTTTVGGTANWQRVSEVTPNDATTYNSTTAAGTTATDDFNLTSAASAGIGSGDTIKLVQVGGRIGSTATTAASLVYRIKGQAGGTVTESASVSVALNGWATHKAAAPYPYQLTSYTNPQTGTAWTPAALDTAQIGYRANVSQTTARRVSTLWALVEFQPLTTTALGIAAESEAAQPVAGLAGVPIGALTDDFNDGAVDPARWPDSYLTGGFGEVGGRARVACTTDYNAFASDTAYRLRESSAHVRMWPPAAGGAAVEAWAQLLIQTTTLGTDVIFEVSAVSGSLVMASRVGYADPGLVSIPYDPVAHAWLRIRETGGQLFWDTSPDGVTWTNRRTATSPAWVGDTTLQVQLIAHRDGGTADFAEFDSFNVVPGGGSEAALDPAAETSGAQALAGGKHLALGVAAETSAAQAPGRARARAVPPVGAVEAGQALGRVKRRTLGTATTAGAGRPLAGAKRTALTTAAVGIEARPAGTAKRAPLGTATASDEALPTAGAKQTVLGTASTVVEARGLATGRTAHAEPAIESTTAEVVAGRKTQPLPPAADTPEARPVTGAKRVLLGTAVDAAAGQPVTAGKTRAAGVAAETAAAQVLATASGLVPADETTTARTLSGSKTRALGVAGEVGAARPVGRVKTQALGGVAEASAARPLTGGRARALAPAEETGLVLDLGRASSQALPTAAETSEAGTLTGGAVTALDRARETSASGPVSGRKTRLLPTATAGVTARPVTGRKTLSLGTAVTTTGAGPVSGAKESPLPVASETVRAERLLIPGRTGTAETVTTAQHLLQRKTRLVVPATATAAARPVTGRKQVALTAATDAVAARPLTGRKVTVLAGAVAVAEAGQLTGSARRLLGTASTVETALVGPQVRLTWASGQDQARPLVGRRQRPAEHLDASTSGPHLDASTSGPDLGTSTSGPVLASATSGPALTTESSGPRLVATTTSGG
ncbi:hypothetical protein ACIQTN_25765 [Streptomyces werraensis]|uniref:hypothetical protein n=1 Tax=Streptomyces werraensis TaxID=68284 RepID=UPI00382ED09C